MSRRGHLDILVATFLVGVSPLSARGEVTAKDVHASINRARGYLVEQQNQIHGNWPQYQSFPGGITSLCVLALLNAGDQPDDPHIVRALGYLRKIEPKYTYVAALQTMVFCAATPRKDRLLIRRNVELLESWQIQEGPQRGGWTYSAGKRRQSGDNSNSQFALLGLNESQRVGVEVSDQTWRLALDYWLRKQHADGSWGYGLAEERDVGTGSMTCAGIASTVIAAGRFNKDASVLPGGRVQCCGEQENSDAIRSIERGLQWLGNNFSVSANPIARGPRNAGRAWIMYYMYGIERVGRLTGKRFIGRHDWYREGAEILVATQDTLRGYWKGAGGPETIPTIATPLALLFLSKGQRPVLVAKAQHSRDNDWNHHRSDSANLTRYAEQAWGRDMTWQTIDLEAATAEDLLQSPVLFISGRDGLRLAGDQQQALRTYVDQGGFLFVEACCDGRGFDQDFQKFMREVFPDNPLRKLPYDHPVWYAETKVDPDYAPETLWGIDACCRTSVVYCPEDLSCYWDLGQSERERDYPKAVEEKIRASFNLGVNILAYATGRQLKNKLDTTHYLRNKPDRSERKRGILHVPKLQHAGGGDEAPAALSNLLESLGHERKMRVSGRKQMLVMTDDRLFDFPIVFMHGRRSFRLSPAERKALATYLRRGGFVFADSICASEEFTSSFQRELSNILAEGMWERIPADHALFTREYGGFDLPSVLRREPQIRSEDDPLKARIIPGAPLLEGLTLDDRFAVIFSPYDISCSLENTPSLECKGYVTEDAARIGINIILYALQQ